MKKKMRASSSFREERKSEIKSTYFSVQIRDKYDDDDGERRISSLFQVNKLLYFLSFPFFFLSSSWSQSGNNRSNERFVTESRSDSFLLL